MEFHYLADQRQVTLRSSVNRSFTSSMEVGVSITHQSMTGDGERTENALRAYVTMVDVDEAGRAGQVP